MSDYRRSIALFAFLGFVSAPAFAGTSVVGPPEPIVDCEFYLNDQPHVAGVLRWLRGALAPLVLPDAAFTGYSPKADAFAALGLPFPYPTGTTMKIESPVGESHPYWLKIYSESGEELARFPFHVPPVVVWKQIKEGDIEDETELAFDLQKEEPRALSVGALIGSVPAGRRFISVRRRMPNLVTVAIGIDVDTREHWKFTDAATPHFIGTSNEEVLSRIEVVKAHFRIPVPAPKRRGGPGPVT
jgi:hypothetical protein